MLQQKWKRVESGFLTQQKIFSSDDGVIHDIVLGRRHYVHEHVNAVALQSSNPRLIDSQKMHPKVSQVKKDIGKLIYPTKNASKGKFKFEIQKNWMKGR